MNAPLRKQACGHDYPHVTHRVWLAFSDGGSYRCPGVRIDPATRHHKPATRQLVAKQLRDLKRWLGFALYDWTVDSSIRSGGRAERPRRVDEYPENNARAWETLADELLTVERVAGDLRRQALAAALTIRQSGP